MGCGKILFLQGPSSAGKSTLATALQRNLEEYWWALEADDITRMQPTGERCGWWEPTAGARPHPSWKPELRLERWLAGYFQCIATIARTGSNVIAVGGWLQTSWLMDLAATLEGIDAYCVGVYCSLEELERREIVRGDRQPGYARSHYDLLHTHAPYDVAVDTTLQTMEEAMALVQQMLVVPPEFPFFARIRSSIGQTSLLESSHRLDTS